MPPLARSFLDRHRQFNDGDEGANGETSSCWLVVGSLTRQRTSYIVCFN